MIDLTIKTLDSANHHFCLEDGTTVGQLKEQIRLVMGIAIEEQRLIFCGSVLTDERTLSECQVHGKVIHLVKRPPPSVRCPPRSQNRPGSHRAEMRQALSDATRVIHRVMNPPLRHQLRQLWSFTPSELVQDLQQAMSMSPTNGRIEFIWRTIEDIRNLMSALYTHTIDDASGANAQPQPEPMDVESPPTEARTVTEDENMREELNNLTGSEDGEGLRGLPRRRPECMTRPRFTRPRDLAQLLEDLDQLSEHCAPYRRHYISMMREAPTAEIDPEVRARRQQFVDLMSALYHSFAHAYHAVSDITFHVGEQYPPLTSDQPTNRTSLPLPLQAQINVLPSEPFRARASSAGSAQSSSANPIPQVIATEVEIPTTSNSRGSPLTGMGAAQSSSAPDPTRFLVEIEARMPLALPIDVALLNGIAAAANDLRPDQASQTQNREPQQTSNTNEQAQASSRQSDLENVLRGLTSGNGVEVVMSMEELSPVAGAVDGNINITNGGLFVSPMPMQMPILDGDAAGDVLNVITSVFQPTDNSNSGRTSDTTWGTAQPGITIRRDANGGLFGLRPLSTLNLLAQRGRNRGRESGPSDASTSDRATSSTASGNASHTRRTLAALARARAVAGGLEGLHETQSALPRDDERSGESLNASQTRRTLAALARARAIAAGLEGHLHENLNALPRDDERSGNADRSRTDHAHAHNRAHALALASMVYDRFMPCDSHHARARLQERRAQYQELHEEQERQRNERPTPIDIDVLMQRNHRFSERHITTMIRFLIGPSTRGAALNAWLVVVYRLTFLPNMQMPEVQIPGEFAFVRQQLRIAMSRLFDRVLDYTESTTSLFEHIVDIILNRHSLYIAELNNYTPIDQMYNVRESLGALLRARMPSLMMLATADISSDQSSVRMYNLFAQLYLDLSSLLLEVCLDGYNGLLVIHETFMIRMISSCSSAAREWLRLLTRETLAAAYPHMRQNNVRQYLRRVDTHPLPPPEKLVPADLFDDEEFEVPRPCPPSDQQVMPPQEEPVPTYELRYLPNTQTYYESSPSTATTESNSTENTSETSQDSHNSPQTLDDESSTDNTPSPTLATSLTSVTPDSPQSPETSVMSWTSMLPNQSEPPAISLDEPCDTINSADTRSTLRARSLSTLQRDSLPLMNRNRVASDSPQLDSASNNSSTDDCVPPIMIIQHWGQELVPVFNRDQNAQREEEDREQDPYSDAYLSGMPSRKRRRIQGMRPPTTLEGFMDESVQQTLNNHRPRAVQERLHALRDFVRTMVRSRSESSPDYSPSRYNNTSLFITDGNPPENAESNESSDTASSRPERSSESKDEYQDDRSTSNDTEPMDSTMDDDF